MMYSQKDYDEGWHMGFQAAWLIMGMLIAAGGLFYALSQHITIQWK